MAPASNFGPVVRDLRAVRGWSQEKLAEMAGLDRSYIGEIERGGAVPSLITAEKLARALQTRLSDLIARCECGRGPSQD